MKLRDLEYLVAIADHGHFGRAARSCDATQPTLSTQVKKLEGLLGVELLERVPKGAVLTRAGERVVGHARAILRHADQIANVGERMRNPEAATLRVGLFPTLAPYLLPHAVPALRERFPGLGLLLAEEKTDVLLTQLEDGRLDAALLGLPIDRRDDLDHVELFEDDFVLAVPSDHDLAGLEEPVAIEALAGETVLLLEDGHCLREQALAICERAGASEYSAFRSTSLETLRQMVAAGVGITLLPRLAVRPPAPESAGVRLLELADPVPSRRIALFWRRTSPYRDFLPRIAEAVRAIPEVRSRKRLGVTRPMRSGHPSG